MLNFTETERATPKKRDVLVRLKDYDEVYEVFGRNKSSEQADRCMQCGDPYCHSKCPLHNYIPAWLKTISERDLPLAFALSNETSPFPEILGKICPHDVLCEGDCSLNEGHGAVAIGAIETHINEKAFLQGMKPKFGNITSTKKVAIIGSGPAGISAATFLLRKGIKVEMFERADRAGGLLTYGIPGFKLDKSKVQRRIDWLTEAGMELHLNVEIGNHKKFEELENDFDAIFVGIGSTKGRFAGIDGEKSANVHLAVDYLTRIQQRNFGIHVENFINVKDKRVLVIGGGDTAMDCIRSSAREGAKSVKCLYRRDKKNMPGSKKEVINSEEEGAEFVFNVSPVSIETSNALATGIKLIKTELSEADESGRQSVKNIEGSEYIEEADVIIYALGFSPEAPEFLNKANVELNSWGGVITNNYQTSNKKVYAGGDCQRGAHLAVTAAADGREAAKAIIQAIS